MLNPIEKFKRSILHLNRSLHHWCKKSLCHSLMLLLFKYMKYIITWNKITKNVQMNPRAPMVALSSTENWISTTFKYSRHICLCKLLETQVCALLQKLFRWKVDIPTYQIPLTTMQIYRSDLYTTIMIKYSQNSSQIRKHQQQGKSWHYIYTSCTFESY